MALELDLKDRKILFELDKDSRMSLSDLARKVRLSKEVVFHRLNNLVERKVILRFQAVSAAYRLGLTAYKIYLRLQDINKAEYDELQKFLVDNKDIFWVGNCKGRWDLIIAVWAKSIEDFFSIHDSIQEKYSRFIQEKQLSVSRNMTQYNRRWMLDSKDEVAEFDSGEKESQVKLDAEDQQILDLLTLNSREKIVDIAKKTGMASDKISYRIKKLEKEKIIRGYKCLFNIPLLGYSTCKSFIFFKNMSAQKKARFIEYCKRNPSVINIVFTFAPWDLEIEFNVKNYEEFYQIMDSIKNEFKDVVNYYDSVLITSEPKQVFLKTK